VKIPQVGFQIRVKWNAWIQRLTGGAWFIIAGEFIVGLFDQFRSIFRKSASTQADEEDVLERRSRQRLNPREGTRVLVIDDSPTILTILKRFFLSANCVPLEAPDAKVGLGLALTQKPELIFLDIVMPGINGFAALRALRKNPRTANIPIIMMSGNEQATAQFFGTHIGADDFMKKPFSRQEVFARIERLLDENGVPHRPAPREEAPIASPPGLAPAPAPSASHVDLSAYLVKSSEDIPPAAPAPAHLSSDAVVAVVSPAPVVQPAVPEHVAQVLQPAPPPAPPVQLPPLSTADLLAQIARCAQLAQSDPNALAALSVLMNQLTSQPPVSVVQPEDTAASASGNVSSAMISPLSV
jgi:twitching motility two-component system response regulator PilH